jgi:hypothetical protein
MPIRVAGSSIFHGISGNSIFCPSVLTVIYQTLLQSQKRWSEPLAYETLKGMERQCSFLFLILRSLASFSFIMGCGTPLQKTDTTPDQIVVPVQTGQTTAATMEIQSLQRQVRDRDQRIAELTSQLELLRRIDRDAERQRANPRLPALLIPTETDKRP